MHLRNREASAGACLATALLSPNVSLVSRADTGTQHESIFNACPVTRLDSPGLDQGRRPWTESPIEKAVCKQTVCLISAAGGAGATTIAAGLARSAAKRGEQVLLLDSDSNSILPLYFGASDPTATHCALPSRHGSGEGSIRVCPNTVTDPTDHSAGVVVTTLPLRALEGMPTLLDPAAVRIVVLVPDVRCAVAVRTLERRLAAEHKRNLFYLVNRFDPSIALHQEIYSWLSTYTGTRTLPFTLANSFEVSNSLSQGVTVVDYAPESKFVLDLHQLEKWLSVQVTG